MMKGKKICVFISMFIILFLIVIAPTIFHQFNDERLLNKVYIEDLEHENRPIEKSNLKLEEKIDFLSKYNKDSHIVSSSHREVLNDENKTMLNKNLLREIKSLQTLKVIPDINISHSIEYTGFETIMYSDVSNPKNHVSLWNVKLVCKDNNQDYYLEFWIDCETKKIYQFLINGNVLFSVDITNFCIKYLGLEKVYMKKFYVIDNAYSQIGVFIR